MIFFSIGEKSAEPSKYINWTVSCEAESCKLEKFYSDKFTNLPFFIVPASYQYCGSYRLRKFHCVHPKRCIANPSGTYPPWVCEYFKTVCTKEQRFCPTSHRCDLQVSADRKSTVVRGCINADNECNRYILSSNLRVNLLNSYFS